MIHNFFDLSGKIPFVTGTSRGLGQYLARALARAGADIAMSSRDETTLVPFATEIQALGRRTASVSLDVRDLESTRSGVTKIEDLLGPIDILVNNPGCNIRKPALDVTF